MATDMATGRNSPSAGAFSLLRQFARARPAVERCEMCSRELRPRHEHLVDPEVHRLLCACDACVILFDGQPKTKFKRVPHTVRFLSDFQMTDGQWDSLMIPIGLAFFFRSSSQGKVVALYPSPAGTIESLLSLDTWDEIVRVNPILAEMQSDVVALLANRVAAGRGAQMAEYWLVPIDECYKLVGLIRTHWRGLAGGTEVWREVAAFFAELKQRTASIQEATHG